MRWILDLLHNGLRFVFNLVTRLPGPRVDYVVIEVSGSYPERTPPAGPLLPRLLRRPWQRPDESLEALRARLERISAAPGVAGVVLRVRGLRASMAAVQSLRDAVAALRRTGKRVVASLNDADLPGYYLATAAEEIWMPEAGYWNVWGLRTEITFFREALDRAGILPEYERIAEYKTAADPFMRSGLSEHHREVLESVLDSLMTEIAGDVAASRRLDPGAARAAIDRSPLHADEAREAGLVDVVGFEDEMPARLGSPGRPAVMRPWAQARMRLPVPYRWDAGRPAVGVVELIGTIVPGESRDSPVPLPVVGGRFAGSDTVARAFRAAERDPRVRAVVFHVDSRGGSALASDLIWREVDRVKRSKPVVVHMGGTAGSGGYYVSCGASHIVAQPATVTGSIGVIAGKMTGRGLMGHLGLNREIVARGEAATIESAFQPFSEEQRGRVRRSIESVYRRFVGRVAAGRRKSEDEVHAVARGRVWTGRQALERGLVDELGDFTVAVRRARELAGIPPAQVARVVTIRPPLAAGIPAAGGAIQGALADAASGVLAAGAALADAAEALRVALALVGEPALLLMPEAFD
jgi:protease-4